MTPGATFAGTLTATFSVFNAPGAIGPMSFHVATKPVTFVAAGVVDVIVVPAGPVIVKTILTLVSVAVTDVRHGDGVLEVAVLEHDGRRGVNLEVLEGVGTAATAALDAASGHVCACGLRGHLDPGQRDAPVTSSSVTPSMVALPTTLVAVMFLTTSPICRRSTMSGVPPGGICRSRSGVAASSVATGKPPSDDLENGGGVGDGAR